MPVLSKLTAESVSSSSYLDPTNNDDDAQVEIDPSKIPLDPSHYYALGR